MSETKRNRAIMAAMGVLAVVCAVLYGPALKIGFLADDLFQISMLEGRFGAYSPAHLYAFAPDNPEATAMHIQRGSLPWWTHPHFRFVMVRPLSSLLLSFDHAVFPRQAYAHHLHSALWFVAALGCGFALVKRLTGTVFAAAFVACFAVDETMAWMVAWLANRCALVCTAFAFLALLVRIRAVESEDDSLRARLIELALWLGAFAGGEYAVGGIAYLGAYTVLGDPRPFVVRGKTLWPALIALGGFMLAYALLGGGVYGGTTYVDPIRETGQFLEVMGHRVPRMLGEVWTNMAGESERFWLRYSGSGLSVRVMPPEIEDLGVQAYRHGIFVTGLSVLFFAPAWWAARRWWSARERRAIRWIVFGSVLALLPIAAIPPATRALMLPNFGAAVFVGGCLVAVGRAWQARSGDWVPRIVLSAWAIGLVYVHAGREYRYAREQIDALLGAQRAYAQYYRTESFVGLDLADKHVVVVATPGLVTGIHGVSMMHVFGMNAPKTWHVLGIGPRPYTLRKIGKRRLELSGVGGAMHMTPQEILFRNPADALRKGERVDAGLFVAEVLNDRNGVGPASVSFTFQWALDDPRLVFLEVGPDGLRPFTIPKRGKTLALPPPALPTVAQDA
ncbi:MAG: hypothetical protein AAGA54_23495 [Myxococcota bacterium]